MVQPHGLRHLGGELLTVHALVVVLHVVEGPVEFSVRDRLAVDAGRERGVARLPGRGAAEAHVDEDKADDERCHHGKKNPFEVVKLIPHYFEHRITFRGVVTGEKKRGSVPIPGGSSKREDRGSERKSKARARARARGEGVSLYEEGPRVEGRGCASICSVDPQPTSNLTLAPSRLRGPTRHPNPPPNPAFGFASHPPALHPRPFLFLQLF